MQAKNYQAVIQSPIGNLGIQTTNEQLYNIDFLVKTTKLSPPKDAFTQFVCNELHNYFQNPHYAFNLSLILTGTPFQQTVWQAMTKISVGETLSYFELAKKLNTSARAIGNACRRNPIPIVIPCHRIVAKNHLGGFNGEMAGDMLAIKKWLLAHEKCKDS